MEKEEFSNSFGIERRGGGEYKQLHIPRLVRELREGGLAALEARQKLVTLGDLALADLLEQSVVDTKTMLGQQVTLEQAIDALLADKSAYGMFIATDLVGFGEINRKFGQERGDEVLIKAAQALKSSIRLTQTPYTDGLYRMVNEHYDSDAYRIGGDEFAALLRSDMPFTNVDPEAVLRDKLLAVVSNTNLQELLAELHIDRFGIRGSIVTVDSERHKNYKQIIAEADPKLHTVCTYMLVRGPSGLYSILVDKHDGNQ